MTVQSLFKRANRWTQGQLSDGEGASKCYCFIGALEHCYRIDTDTATRRQRQRFIQAKSRTLSAIQALFPYRSAYNIAAFNDHPNTTIEDVRAVARRARV